METSPRSPTRGFTLIELLVVIAIIGVLATVVIASMRSARQKSRDARSAQDFKSLMTALNLYYDDNGHYPPNINPSGAACERGINPGTFATALQPLVAGGYIKSIPVHANASSYYGYCYYDYTTWTDPPGLGALLATQMESIAATTQAPMGSCRPFTANWCSSTIANTWLCFCSN